MVANLLDGIEVQLGVDYLADKEKLAATGRDVSYTQERLTLTLITRLVHCNIVLCVLRQRH